MYFVSVGIQERSIVITTYALCGFANISSIGIMLGALGAMAPNQRSAIAQVVVRAMIAGTVACFMTACIASNYFIIILKKIIMIFRPRNNLKTNYFLFLLIIDKKKNYSMTMQ